LYSSSREPSLPLSTRGGDTMEWQTPDFRTLEMGFEVTMYVYNE
jgi:coenzyme PQQ precursor peptide PqqA